MEKISEKLYFIKFSSQFYGEYVCLNKMQCFIQKWTLNIKRIFLIDWQGIWFKNYFEAIKSRKSARILMKISKMLLFSKSFSVSTSFSVSSKNHPCYPNKEKTYKLLSIAVVYFPLSIQMKTLTLYNNCYVILTLDSADSDAWFSPRAFIKFFKKYFITAMDTEIYSRYGKWFNPPAYMSDYLFSSFWWDINSANGLNKIILNKSICSCFCLGSLP